MNPMISVIMPVYNSEKYLKEAIESILNQSYKDFELIIINDGSTDDSAQIINLYKDNRIKLINNFENKGLVYSLNLGIEVSKGKYIARMDSDDICYKNRFQKQVEFMEKNTSAAVCGGNCKVFGENIKNGVMRKYMDPTSIRYSLLFRCELVHPTVIMRKDVLIKNNYKYNEEDCGIEDFSLWQRISFNHEIYNMPKILLRYRIVNSSITKTAEKNIVERKMYHKKMYKQGIEHYGFIINEEQLETHWKLCNLRNSNGIHEFYNIIEYIKEINEQIGLVDIANERIFKKVLYRRLVIFTINNPLISKDIIKFYYKNKYYKYYKPNIKEVIKILSKLKVRKL